MNSTLLTRKQRLWLLLPFTLVVVPFLIWPALFGLFASFTNYVPVQTTPLRFVGFDNYNFILHQSDFQAAIRNILIYTISTVSFELILGLGIAYALRKPFRGRGIIRFILLLPWLISPVASGVMWHFLSSPVSGLLDYLPALFRLPELVNPLGNKSLALLAVVVMEIWRKTPLVSFLVLPGILAIPAAQWDLAEIEGMSVIIRLHHIVLPRLRLLLLTISLVLIGDSLGTAETILILTGGGPGSSTITPGLYSYQQAFNVFDWIGGATSAWLIAGAVILIGIGYLLMAQREAAS